MKKGKPKGILVKISFTFVLCFAVMLTLSLILLNHVLEQSVDKLEVLNVRHDLASLQNAVNSKLQYLQTLTADYAVWDDTYRYVQDNNEEYASSNLTDDTYSNLKLNLMILISDSGQIIYGKTIDFINHTTADTSGEAPGTLEKLKLLRNTDKGYIVRGIIMMPGGPMMVASHPIVKSDGNGPVKGNLVMGRYIDDSILKDIGSSLNLSIGMEMARPEEIPQIQQDDGAMLQITPLNSALLKGSVLIPDLFKQSGVKLVMTMHRDIHQMGLIAIAVTLAVLMIIFALDILLLWILANKFVLSRISRLHKGVISIAENKNLSQRVAVTGGRDEIYELSANINNMLAMTEALNQTIRSNNEELEQRALELTQANKALQEEKEKISFMAYHDSLTGLPNGIYFHDFLSRTVVASNRAGKPIAVLFIDLDGFKMINDTLGHAAGDELLICVARRLNEVLRKSDFIARIGGDEFIISIGNLKEIHGVEVIASKILRALSEPFVVNGQECFISASIGISLYPADGGNAEELTKNADLAMYKAKDMGKNRFCFCNQAMKDQVIENMVLSNQLWRAAERSEFELYYQPQVNCLTGEITGMEALIRWHHADRGLVMPGKFINLAEQTGAIVTIGEWVMATACQQCRVWQEKYFPNLRMAVNVSIKQLQNFSIVHQVEKILKKTGMNPDTLELEITESIFMKEAEYMIQILDKLKDLGVEIVIDDFGTEYASMSYLKHMPVNRIKIAMPFIQGLDVNEKDQAITKALIILAKSMGMSVIAEGVETKGQHDFLMQKLCDETQGYYFYQPMPAYEIEKILKQHFIG